MSTWQAEKEEQNQRSLARLCRALPIVFPPTVLARALDRPFIPPTPRLAIESYWRAHPLRADRLARALAARTGPPAGWTWRMSQNRQNRPTSDISRATGSVPRAGIQLRRRLLLCVRSTRLQARLAQGSMGHRAQQECGMAIVLASLRGSSGTHRMTRHRSCAACKDDAAAKLAGACGRTPK